MKNKIPLIVVASLMVIVMVAGLIKGFGNFSKQNNPANGQNSSQSNGQGNGNTGPKSIEDLMAMSYDMTCTWKLGNGYVNNTDGKIDISNKKFNLTLNMPNPNGGDRVAYHIINDGAMVYSWGMEDGAGVKMTLNDVKNLNDNGAKLKNQIPGSSLKDWQVKYYLQCSKLNVSDGEFTPPSDVNFKDFYQILTANLPSKSNQIK